MKKTVLTYSIPNPVSGFPSHLNIEITITLSLAGPRQVTITSLGNSCDWTGTALADMMTQSEDHSHHQAGRG